MSDAFDLVQGSTDRMRTIGFDSPEVVNAADAMAEYWLANNTVVNRPDIDPNVRAVLKEAVMRLVKASYSLGRVAADLDEVRSVEIETVTKLLEGTGLEKFLPTD